MTETSANFGFLKAHDPLLLRLAADAEAYFTRDPNTSLFKLRQLGEALAQQVAATAGLWSRDDQPQNQIDLLRDLEDSGFIDRDVAQLFHLVRKSGNQAAHEFTSQHAEAMNVMRATRKAAVWFHRTIGRNPKFKPGEFQAPKDPTDKLRALEEEVARLRLESDGHKESAAKAKALADAERRKAEENAQLVELYDQDRKAAEGLVAETEAAFAQYQQGLADTQRQAAEKPKEELDAQRQASAAAAQDIQLDEEETRLLIDQQLRDAGWEASTTELRFARGTRPAKGRNMAIAEWPTESGPADYVLFMGLTPVAVIEAKQKRKNARAYLRQAERYSAGFLIKGALELPEPKGHQGGFSGWDGGTDDHGKPQHFRIPLIYSTNGRGYFKQLESESGIWFRDVRCQTNIERVLDGWHTPDGVKKLFDKDISAAHDKLKKTPLEELGLRDYQMRAITAAEDALEAGQRTALLALATGTGKTRLVIGLLYRLIESKRIDRALFLVDRNALAEQTDGAFGTMRPDGIHTFKEVFDVEGTESVSPALSTKVHIATVQAMVQRIFHPNEDSEAPAIDAYDCIIIDEAHRGYTLDKEMAEGELAVRSFRDYVSTYRRVLDHFDAIKIGLTATPALHTREIFGDAVFTYGYREAVVDGWLIDHEPPLQLTTVLASKGIHFDKGQKVSIVTGTGDQRLEELPDEMDFEVEAFNKKVITASFNEVVCETLAQYFEPDDESKVLVFCANDNHADMVVHLLKKALQETWGEEAWPNNSVVKVTSKADKVPGLIRRYKNERQPKIAVTVDLLTTGIDVPKISHLVFLRRVKSRILYEQMLGRATRLCDEINKDIFYIYDAVDLYAALESVSSMKPVAALVKTDFETLIDALVHPKAHMAPGSKDEHTYADDVKKQIVSLLRRRVRKTKGRYRTVDWLEAADTLEEVTGSRLPDFPEQLHQMTAEEAAAFFGSRPEVASLVERLFAVGAGPPPVAYVSDHRDSIFTLEHGYGSGRKPEDYLEGFKKFVSENVNTIPALAVVTQRPKDLTREQLRELRLKLDEAGYNLTSLRSAWRETKNQDIAATIIGFIRQMALGSPLVPYEERVDKALKRIFDGHHWTAPQRKWLERIAHQLKSEVVIDRETFEKGAFQNKGGFDRINKQLGGKLDAVLSELRSSVWTDEMAG
ncbi:MAG: type I restriction-modification system endonuclease [Myxococcota bacterium]